MQIFTLVSKSEVPGFPSRFIPWTCLIVMWLVSHTPTLLVSPRCIIQLGLPGTVQGIELDTSFFTGNFAPRASLQAIRHHSPTLCSPFLLPPSPNLISYPLIYLLPRLATPPILVAREGGAGQKATDAQIEAVEKIHSEEVKYCTVLYCIILYCTVSYLSVANSSVAVRAGCRISGLSQELLHSNK